MNNWFNVLNQAGNVTQAGKDFNKLTVVPEGHTVHIFIDGKRNTILKNQDQLDGWLEGQQRKFAWKPEMTEQFGQHTMTAIAQLNGIGTDINNAIKGLSNAFGPVSNYNPPKELIGTHDLTRGNVAKMSDLTGTTEGFADNYDAKGGASHYKDIVPGMQYMEMMQYMLAKFTGVEAHLMGQLYKYLMRCGNKDATLQELTKVHWYLEFLMAWHKNGCKPFTHEEQLRLLAMESVL
jgi:hypothetical protein